ncbi:MAG: sulfite exporter TauE/SafE family protein [Nitrospira sp. NTP2]|nr:sulfite exporter TauE/SafE family protein [Nitrospira sp. NTP2]
MEVVLIGVAALLASGLTFFSGFGVGTILMPVFALFFPVPLAIAATAVVHFANNLFKFGLMAKQADWRVVARFGVPAAFAAMGGAVLLTLFDRLPVVANYSLGDSTFTVTTVKAVIGVLIMVFALLEFWPRFQALTFPPRWLPLGGALSGFFGGLSGNQGAFRSAFLLKAGLSKEAFVATGIVSAVIVDASRLLGYGIGFMTGQFTQSGELATPVFVGTVCACVGSYAGMRLLRKVTFVAVRIVVAAGMLLIGLGLITGLL